MIHPEVESARALRAAHSLQADAAECGFDWPDVTPVFGKVREELAELEIHRDDDAASAEREDELGDLLFACVNLARHLNVNAEVALAKANDKFQRRFGRVTELVNESGQNMATLSLNELDQYWQQCKREGL